MKAIAVDNSMHHEEHSVIAHVRDGDDFKAG
jgi:hypothetical protein